ALHRALALAHCEHVAVGVSEQLDLDVAGTLDVPLAENAFVAERGFRLTFCRGERLVELVGRTHDPHSAPAAARRSFDDEREADLAGLAGRDDGHPRLPRASLRLELLPARAPRVR